ncbi:diacylglycerol kinase [Pseudotabrizicola alkalilacus]|uniref:Diacylglycerol kinase n=1 Tax=Pseudotabrizicola alkalilacus TaxID=2305252 RepID=A0A411YX88_9RHOB|nr:diacylglycerol kinase [Pseudotabrizicola alkalilacus]RGP35507.1 diacylglycerol kinase [Pseudotabrizicola alkalilacus]
MTVKPPRRGLWHMVDATGYSLAGLRRLLAETSARQEIAGGGLGALVLVWAQAGAWQWLGFVVLFAALLAVEALNTAIEVLVNHISPGWSEAAKQAKDLGSLAVALMIFANLAYVGMIVLREMTNG